MAKGKREEPEFERDVNGIPVWDYGNGAFEAGLNKSHFMEEVDKAFEKSPKDPAAIGNQNEAVKQFYLHTAMSKQYKASKFREAAAKLDGAAAEYVEKADTVGKVLSEKQVAEKAMEKALQKAEEWKKKLEEMK